MSPKPPPKLRIAPPALVLSEKQREIEALLKLTTWTEVPFRLTEESAAGLPPFLPLPEPDQPVLARSEAVQAPTPGARPWHGEPSGAVHPFNILLPKELQQKMDFAWKRSGYKSMKAFILHALVQETDRLLKDLGETP